MKKIKLTETELTRLITKVIKEQDYRIDEPGGYDEFLEEMLVKGQTLQKMVEAIRKSNTQEMYYWDLDTEEKALGSFGKVANLIKQQINDFRSDMD
tara:strand:- start:60 stop:347 length:288 start_codon:yes stop_codon:yes gene_type:complete